MDMDLERARRVARLAGLQVVGCVGGCQKRLPSGRRAATGMRLTMLGDVWKLSACPRCLGGFVDRVDEDVGYAQAAPEQGMALQVAWPGPWHLVAGVVAQATDPIASPPTIPVFGTLCGREAPLPASPVRLLRFMAVGYPHSRLCQSCLASRNPKLARDSGPEVFSLIRAAATDAIREAGHDPSVLDAVPRIGRFVEERDVIVARAAPGVVTRTFCPEHWPASSES